MSVEIWRESKLKAAVKKSSHIPNSCVMLGKAFYFFRRNNCATIEQKIRRRRGKKVERETKKIQRGRKTKLRKKVINK